MSSVFHFVQEDNAWLGSVFGSPETLLLGATQHFTTGGYRSAVYGICISFELDADVTDSIDNVVLDFVVKNIIEGGTWDTQLSFVAPLILDATEPTSQSDCLTDLGFTLTAPVLWSPDNSYVDGQIVPSPNIASILQEIINQVDWASGNRVNLYVICNSPAYVGTDLYPENRLELYNDDPVTITITEEPWTEEAHVYSDLTFIQVIDALVNRKDYIDILDELEQIIDAALVHTGVYEDTIDIVEAYDYIKTLDVELEHFLFIQETIIANSIVNADIEHELLIVEDLIGNSDNHKQLVHELVLEQDIGAVYGQNGSYIDVLILEQDIHSDSLFVEFGGHDVELVQEFTADGTFQNAKNVTHDLVLVETLGYNWVKSGSVEHELTITQAFTSTGGLASLNCRQDLIYCPRSSIPGYSDKPTIAYQDIVLTCGVNSITLRKPNFSDRQELMLQRIFRQNLGGEQISYRDYYWNKTRAFRYKFEALSDTDREDMFLFLANSLGLEVTMVDHEGIESVGYILNSQGESGQFYRECGNTTEFDFETIQ
jgi:hypothetical protein